MRLHTTSATRHFCSVRGRLALLLAAILAAGTAAADDWPALRPGMWEFNRTVETPGAPGKSQTMQSRKCTNPGDDMKKQNAMLTRSGCRISPVIRAGSTYTWSAECKLQGASGTSKSVLSADGDSAYAIRVESDFGGEPTRELLRATRVADCPR